MGADCTFAHSTEELRPSPKPCFEFVKSLHLILLARVHLVFAKAGTILSSSSVLNNCKYIDNHIMYTTCTHMQLYSSLCACACTR